MAFPSKSQLNWTLHGIELIQQAQKLIENNSEKAKKWHEEAEEWLAS